MLIVQVLDSWSSRPRPIKNNKGSITQLEESEILQQYVAPMIFRQGTVGDPLLYYALSLAGASCVEYFYSKYNAVHDGYMYNENISTPSTTNL